MKTFTVNNNYLPLIKLFTVMSISLPLIEVFLLLIVVNYRE